MDSTQAADKPQGAEQSTRTTNPQVNPEALEEELIRDFEHMFSRENLQKSKYLISRSDIHFNIPVYVIYNEYSIASKCTDPNIINEALSKCKAVRFEKDRKVVIPNIKPRKCLIIRHDGDTALEQSIQNYLNERLAADPTNPLFTISKQKFAFDLYFNDDAKAVEFQSEISKKNFGDKTPTVILSDENVYFTLKENITKLIQAQKGSQNKGYQSSYYNQYPYMYPPMMYMPYAQGYMPPMVPYHGGGGYPAYGGGYHGKSQGHHGGYYGGYQQHHGGHHHGGHHHHQHHQPAYQYVAQPNAGEQDTQGAGDNANVTNDGANANPNVTDGNVPDQGGNTGAPAVYGRGGGNYYNQGGYQGNYRGGRGGYRKPYRGGRDDGYEGRGGYQGRRNYYQAAGGEGGNQGDVTGVPAGEGQGFGGRGGYRRGRGGYRGGRGDGGQGGDDRQDNNNSNSNRQPVSAPQIDTQNFPPLAGPDAGAN